LLSSKSHSATGPEFCAHTNTGMQITRQIDKKRHRFIAKAFLNPADESWTNQYRQLSNLENRQHVRASRNGVKL
jgi:hypothetical protein